MGKQETREGTLTAEEELQQALSELEQQEQPSGSIISKALHATVGAVGAIVKAVGSRAKDEDEEDSGDAEEVLDEHGVKRPDDDEDEFDEDELDELDELSDDDEEEDDEDEVDDERGVAPLTKSVTDEVLEELPESIAADEVIAGLVKGLSEALERRLDGITREVASVRSEVRGLRKSMLTVSKGIDAEAAKPPIAAAQAAPATSPYTVLSRQLQTGAGGGQDGEGEFEELMTKGLLADVVSLAEAQTLRRLRGTEQWDGARQARLDAIRKQLEEKPAAD